jgi:hypothetical protein
LVAVVAAPQEILGLLVTLLRVPAKLLEGGSLRDDRDRRKAAVGGGSLAAPEDCGDEDDQRTQ